MTYVGRIVRCGSRDSSGPGLKTRPTYVRDRIERIEREVELQHVDSWLAEEAKLSSFRVGLDHLTHRRFGYSSLASHTCHLEIGGGRRDVGIEPGGRRRPEVDRYRCSRILLA